MAKHPGLAAVVPTRHAAGNAAPPGEHATARKAQTLRLPRSTGADGASPRHCVPSESCLASRTATKQRVPVVAVARHIDHGKPRRDLTERTDGRPCGGR